ncbi:hypothetical protein F4821DRAFT_277014 [Hypoxylon rubiginosum]|uniref:Uncharacterized protein n=1 Tax=Hypoxylon rubiginosum TaxID=110542 RepID=A0ACC0D8L0_9PEZI|nr:hypothetical protein F4821DRAFT_277014 [Hypoxylon rubiginosum]
MSAVRAHATAPQLTIGITPQDLPDGATEEEHAVWLVSHFLEREVPTESASNNTAGSSAPIFGSTALRPGMHAEMASMNLQARYRERSESRPPTPFPYDDHQTSRIATAPAPNRPQGLRRVRWAGADRNRNRNSSMESPPEHPSPRTLDRLLNEGDQAARRRSAEERQARWSDQSFQEQWSIHLAVLTIRAKHERLDEEQHPWLTYTRRLMNVESIEAWWWVREIKAQQKKRRREENGRR